MLSNRIHTLKGRKALFCSKVASKRILFSFGAKSTEMKKFALVTGASTGIGYATVRDLLGAGYTVFGSVRKAKDAERLKQDFGADCIPLQFDVCDEKAIQDSIKTVEATVGTHGLSLLVNNAGLAVTGPLQHIPVEEVQYQFEVNVMGVLRVTQALLPLLGAAPNSPFPPGKIINVSSVAGLFTSPLLGPYCMSKFALESLSDGLRRELVHFGIKVVVVEPGPVKTPIWDKTLAEVKPYTGTFYEPLIAAHVSRTKSTEAKAIPVERVSQKILRIAQHPSPRARYIIARAKWLFVILKYLVPDRLIDYLMYVSAKKTLGRAANDQ